jgi:hypothetical protein
MHAIPLRVDGYVVRDSCLRTSGHGQHLTAVERNASTQAGSLRHGEHLQPSLTQRDIWVMHRSVGAGSKPAPTEPAPAESTLTYHQHAVGQAAGLRSAM